jgi:hypothetical protein
MTTIAPFRQCTSFEVIEVALVIDSSLCARVGGSSKLMRSPKAYCWCQPVLRSARTLQEDADLSMEIHCDPNTDPIKPFLT